MQLMILRSLAPLTHQNGSPLQSSSYLVDPRNYLPFIHFFSSNCFPGGQTANPRLLRSFPRFYAMKYQYEPLPTRDHHIRLAVIHPGEFEDDIILSFRTSSFPDHASPYEALSYAWGSKKRDQPVYVDRDGAATARPQGDNPFVEIQATQNLVVALRHLRSADEPRVMWIDALCINQEDEAEKGPQVALMGEIFRLAHRVIAWLGPEENDSAHAMELIGRCGPEVEFNTAMVTLSAARGCTDPRWSDKDGLLPFDERDLRSIYHLISRDWFDRLWVRQEICLANSEATTLCGFQRVAWKYFRRALACLYLKQIIYFESYNQLTERLNYLSGLTLQTSRTHLSDLRLEFGNSCCQDPLDRIYAIMALLPDREQQFISSPDYTRPYAELYTDVTSKWIDNYGSLSILHDCELREDQSWPSWVPDWSKHSDLYRAIPPTHASSQLKAWHEQTPPKGLRVIGISKTVVGEHRQIIYTNINDFNARLKDLHKVLSELILYGQHTAETYARTLSRDLFPSRWEPPGFDYHDFDTAKRVVELMVTHHQFDRIDFGEFLKTRCLEMTSIYLNRTRLFQGAGGYLGVASQSAQSGDEVCVILGCPAPMLLRPLDNGKYRLVGPCFVDGLMYGEALLGPLPKNVRPVNVYQKNGYMRGFKDCTTGKISYEDPRLRSLPVDLRNFRQRLSKNPNSEIHIEPKALRERGVQLRCFDLV